MWSIQFQLLRAYALDAEERARLRKHCHLGNSRVKGVKYDLRVAKESDMNSVVAYGEVQLLYDMNNPDVQILMGLLTELTQLAEGTELDVEDDMGLIGWDEEKGAFELMGNKHGGMLSVPHGMAEWPWASELVDEPSSDEAPPVKRPQARATMPPGDFASEDGEPEPPVHAPVSFARTDWQGRPAVLELDGVPTAGIVRLARAPSLEVSGDRVAIEGALDNQFKEPVCLDRVDWRIWDRSQGLLYRNLQSFGAWFRRRQELLLELQLPPGLAGYIHKLDLDAYVSSRHRTPVIRARIDYPDAPGGRSSLVIEELEPPPGHPRYRVLASAYRIDHEGRSGLWFGVTVDETGASTASDLRVLVAIRAAGEVISRQLCPIVLPSDGGSVSFTQFIEAPPWPGEAELTIEITGTTQRRNRLGTFRVMR